MIPQAEKANICSFEGTLSYLCTISKRKGDCEEDSHKSCSLISSHSRAALTNCLPDLQKANSVDVGECANTCLLPTSWPSMLFPGSWQLVLAAGPTCRASGLNKGGLAKLPPDASDGMSRGGDSSSSLCSIGRNAALHSSSDYVCSYNVVVAGSFLISQHPSPNISTFGYSNTLCKLLLKWIFHHWSTSFTYECTLLSPPDESVSQEDAHKQAIYDTLSIQSSSMWHTDGFADNYDAENLRWHSSLYRFCVIQLCENASEGTWILKTRTFFRMGMPRMVQATCWLTGRRQISYLQIPILSISLEHAPFLSHPHTIGMVVLSQAHMGLIHSLWRPT